MNKPKTDPLLLAHLQELRLERKTLVITPGERPAATQLVSHIGGDPYFEAGEEWPTNPDTGQPLELIFQLVNDGTMPWPFPAQLVQFYHNYYAGEPPFDESHQPKDYRLKLYANLRPDRQVRLARPAALPPIGFSQITGRPEPSLPDREELPDISPATQARCQALTPDDWSDAYYQAVEALIGEQELGSWVGGYAHWLQGAWPTGTFWLQFDSTEDFMWGDSGLLYFFSDPENPLNISFQLQCC